MVLSSGEKVIRFRWIALLTAAIFIPISFLRGEMTIAILAFILGAISGFSLDCLGVRILKLWKYPRQEFLGGPYFGLVVPTWGFFGMSINLFWQWIQLPNLITFFVITTLLIGLYELPNIKSGSWQYFAPTWLIIAGWFPLIFVFRILFIMLSAIVP